MRGSEYIINYFAVLDYFFYPALKKLSGHALHENSSREGHRVTLYLDNYRIITRGDSSGSVSEIETGALAFILRAFSPPSQLRKYQPPRPSKSRA